MNLAQARVFIVGNDGMIKDMYLRQGISIVDNIKKANIVQFTGGHDVSPKYYADERHPTTSCSEERDKKESQIFRDSRNPYQLKVGICRGAQFLCVMNGGKLFQDVDHHAIGGTHPILYYTEDGVLEPGVVTSTHHQMMFPKLPNIPNARRPRDLEGEDYPKWELWGGCDLTTYRDRGEDRHKGTDPNDGPDYEIIFWPGTKSLGFQGHPEYGSEPCRELFFRCLTRAFKTVDAGFVEANERAA